MTFLLTISRWIDGLSARMGVIASWLVLIACFISAGNAVSRYLFSASSNAWLEIQWYLFSGIFLLGAPHTLRMNEHVRVDLVYSHVPAWVRLRIDIFGLLLFLMPATIILVYMTWPFFLDSWMRNEESNNAGGLIRWPVKLLLPLGFALLLAQGISELIKRVAAIRGLVELDTRYDRPTQ